MDWKLTDQQILNIVTADIEESKAYFDSQIRPKIEDHYKKYKADSAYYEKLMEELSKKSKYISSDIQDAIEGALPGLMKIFYGTDDIMSVQGRTAEDDTKAENMQQLCNFQITTQNGGFLLFYRWIKDSLITALGVVKAHWQRDYDKTERQATVGYDQLIMLHQYKGTEVKSVEEVFGGINDIGESVPMYNVTYIQTKLKTNKPILENMDGAGLLYDPQCTSVDDAQYMIHRKYTTVDDLRRKEQNGIYDHIDDAVDGSSDTSIDTMKEIVDDGSYSYTSQNSVDNQARNRVVLYEYYGKIDVNGDGLLEDVIITVAGDTIISKQENIYGMFPFFVLSPILEPFTLHGRSFADLIGQLQDLKTGLIKQLMVNIAQSNDGREYIDPAAVNLQDLVGNKKFIRVNANGGAISQYVQSKSFTPIQPMTMSVLEYIDATKENRSGITRYNQGLDTQSLNHTASGIERIMNAANQRLELIARIMAETGMKQMFRFLIMANQKFIDEQTVVRLTNQYMQITPDDLSGDFDLSVNAGTGVADKENDNKKINEIMQIQASVIKAGWIPQNIAYDYVFNATKKKLEIMGYKNVDDFIPTPEVVKGYQQQQAMTQQQGGMTNAGGQLIPGGQPEANGGNGALSGSQGRAPIPQQVSGAMPAGGVPAMGANMPGGMG